MKTAKLVVYAIKQFQFIFIFTVDEFEALCGDRNKGYKTVETLTGPRVQGLYQVKRYAYSIHDWLASGQHGASAVFLLATRADKKACFVHLELYAFSPENFII